MVGGYARVSERGGLLCGFLDSGEGRNDGVVYFHSNDIFDN